MSISSSFSALVRPVLTGTAVLLLGLAAGCTYSKAAPEVAPCEATPQSVTYAGVISPIFEANCRQCHSGRGGGIDFSNYQGISRFPSEDLLGSIEHAPSYSPMPKGRAKLSECDIKRIKVWIEAGKPNN